MMEITRLAFDSDLFGYPVGKIQLHKNWDEKVFLEKAQEYQLVYIFSGKPLDVSVPSIQLMDTKLTFGKSISTSIEATLEIRPYSGEITGQLLKLALESGIYSRFNLDARLTQNEFQKLYAIWVQKALESNSILEAPQLQGMVTYSLAGNSASIGLIAVDQDSQGKGWGKKLMRAAEGCVARHGLSEIEVVTQQANSPACKLYESLGYGLKDRTFVYHYWNQ